MSCWILMFLHKQDVCGWRSILLQWVWFVRNCLCLKKNPSIMGINIRRFTFLFCFCLFVCFCFCFCFFFFASLFLTRFWQCRILHRIIFYIIWLVFLPCNERFIHVKMNICICESGKAAKKSSLFVVICALLHSKEIRSIFYIYMINQ